MKEECTRQISVPLGLYAMRDSRPANEATENRSLALQKVPGIVQWTSTAAVFLCAGVQAGRPFSQPRRYERIVYPQ